MKRIGTDDKKALVIKFNTAYYLAKNERPFSDCPEVLELQEKNGVRDIGKAYLTDKKCAEFTKYVAHVIRTELDTDLKNCNYFTCLNDGSTDSSITEQEIIDVLYLKDEVPTVRYLSIETLNVVNAPGIVASIEDAFKRVSCKDFMDELVGINVDGASVNLGRHKGVGTLLKEKSPWIQVIHCFNHRVELALKDAFRTTSFEEVDSMLCKLYCLYQRSPKRLSELRELSQAFDKTVPKPSKATGTCWIDHKYRAMELFFKHFGPYMSHLEQLTQTDSQALKRTEICGLVKKWKNANLIINIAIYRDVLAPIRRLAVSLQEGRHKPVKAIRRITEFT